MKIVFPSEVFLSTIDILQCTISSLSILCSFMVLNMIITEKELHGISKMKCKGVQ